MKIMEMFETKKAEIKLKEEEGHTIQKTIDIVRDLIKLMEDNKYNYAEYLYYEYDESLSLEQLRDVEDSLIGVLNIKELYYDKEEEDEDEDSRN